MTYKAANTVDQVSMGTSDYIAPEPPPAVSGCDNLLHELIMRPITSNLITNIAPQCNTVITPYSFEYTSEYK